MNKKALSLAICMAMAIPTASNALSLGEIESKSSLNQPFQGKINLLSTSVAEAKSLRVRVASPDVFNRVGIDRPAFLNNIRFRTTVQNGRPVILVSSNQPINEPFLNFLLEVSWPNGQLLKEYTVLLDPPVLMRPNTAIASNNAGVRAEPIAQGRITRPAVQPQRVQQQPSRVQQPRRVVKAAAPARRAPERSPVAAPARVASASQTRNYRVRRGDTLSKIAGKLGYQGVRKEQMMVALFDKNRKAFSQGNMNNLKSGVVMARPSVQEARSTTIRTAKSQIVAQARSWKAARAEQVVKAKDSSKSTNQTARLEVMGKTDSVAGSETGSGKGSVAELNKQLAMLTESLTSKQNENEELKSRVSELESLLRKKNRLITLKSEQLAGLQVNLGGESAPVPATAETIDAAVNNSTAENPDNTAENITENVAENDQPVVANQGADIQEQLAGSLANENGEIIRTPDSAVVVNTPEVVEAVTPTPKLKPTPPFKNEAAEESSFDIMSMISSPTALGIGGGSLLALLGGLAYMRRRKSKGDEAEDFSNMIDDGLHADQNGDFANDESIFVDNNDMIDESEFVMHDEDIDAHTDLEENHPEPMSAESDNELDDLIQEADVYIVYGLHDQAESEIKRAIINYPNNAALHAKLLENYKAAGEKESFEEATKVFLELEADDKQNYWDEICEWGKALFPDSKLYDSSSLPKMGGVAMLAGTAIASAGDKAEELVGDMTNTPSDDDLIEGTILDKSEKLNLDTEMSELDDLDAEIDGLEDFDLDDILGEDDSIDPVAEVGDLEGFDTDIIDTVDTNMINLDDNFTIDIDDAMSDVTDKAKDSIIDVATDASDDLAFSMDDDSLDKLLDEEDFSEVSLEEGLDMAESHDLTSLNLELDSEDFDKIMPGDHAYKSAVNESIDLKLDDDNLLAGFDDNLSFLDLESGTEVIEETQVETKIDLAKAYIDMGDIEGARSTLEEVMEEGSDEQKRQAEELLHNNG